MRRGRRGGDSLTSLRHALRIGAKPDVVLLNVDEYMLIGRTIGLGGLRLAGNLGLFNEISRRERLEMMRRIFMGINLQTTWQSIWRLAAEKPPADTSIMLRDDSLILQDGYRVSSRSALRRVRGRLPPRAYAAGAGQEMAKPFSDRRLQQLRELLRLAKTEGIEVYVFTTPEHPITRAGRLHSQALKNLQKLLHTECSKFGFVYRDFSELASFQGDPDEFIDSTHQTSVNMQRMTNALFGLPPRESVTRVPPDLEILQKHGMLPATVLRR